MGNITGFKEYPHAALPKAAPTERVAHYQEFIGLYQQTELHQQATRY